MVSKPILHSQEPCHDTIKSTILQINSQRVKNGTFQMYVIGTYLVYIFKHLNLDKMYG